METTMTYESEVAAGMVAMFMGVWVLVALALYIVMVIALWKMFEKAGQAGWKALIPFYNSMVLFSIAGRPMWWFLLLFIPFVNIVISVLLALDLAKSYGKDELFGIIALFLFQSIGYLILGFGGAEYKGPAAAQKTA